MTTTISLADWVDVLAIELTFVKLYQAAPQALKHEITATLRRLAGGTGEEELRRFTSRVPNFERALSSFSPEEQSCFAPQFSIAVTEFADYLVGACTDQD